jgi:2-iminobutanoate/2-iminopropanoate deaminase
MKIIQTKNAPAPIGPYNQAVVHENTIYISGQVALDPQSGKMDNANIAEETHQVMRNLGAVLEAAGSDYDHIIKCSIFILDMNEFKAINEVYASFFKDHHPARETVEVSRLPAGARVEISAIAVRL